MAQFRGVELLDLEIISERLILRPWRCGDAAAPDVADAERERGTGLSAAVVGRRSGDVVGAAALRLPFAGRPADLAYEITPLARGNGYGTEVAHALARWTYAQGVHRVEAHLPVTDLASAHVAMRAGFGFEGVRRDALRIAGGRRDLAVFARTADDPGTPIKPAFAPLPAEGLSDGVLGLREPVPADADAFAEQESDPLTLQVGFTGAAPPRAAIDRMLARARLDWLVGHAAPFTMVDAASGRFAGSLRLRLAGPPNIGGIGYAVHPAFRGRGYTSRALRLLAPWAFERADFARLELGAKQSNVASQRAAASAGFEPDGVRRARMRNADGTFSDEVRFALINPRYR